MIILMKSHPKILRMKILSLTWMIPIQIMNQKKFIAKRKMEKTGDGDIVDLFTTRETELIISVIVSFCCPCYVGRFLLTGVQVGHLGRLMQ